MLRIVPFFLLAVVLTACGGDSSSPESSPRKVQIISSIKPVQVIVYAIAGDHADSYQLIPDYASPHNYSFKPSDIRKVKQADIIFRIDEHMEAMLNPVFENLSKNTPLVSLAKAKGIQLLAIAGDHKHEADGNEDFHIWTSPQNAIVMANVIAQSLTKHDPENAKNYQKNLAQFISTVNNDSKEIALKLATVKTKPYIVFHNSWQYFAAHYQLEKPIIASLQESISPSAKTISEIRKTISTKGIKCIFSDPGVKPASIRVLTENLGIQNTEIDVLARKLTIDNKTYINWLKNMSKEVLSCLSN